MINRIRPVARDVNVVEDRFTVFLMDSGKLKIPFQRFTRLLAASREQRRAVRVNADVPAAATFVDALRVQDERPAAPCPRKCGSREPSCACRTVRRGCPLSS